MIAPALSPPERKSWRRIAGPLAFLAVLVLLGLTVKDEVSAVSTALLSAAGLSGLWAGSFLFATCPVPLPLEPLLLVAAAGGLPVGQTFVVVASAAVTAGPACYAAGRLLGRVDLVQVLLARTGVSSVMEARGATVLMLAALTPLPFAPVAWSAGAAKGSFASLLIASLARTCKIAVSLTIITLGWSLL